MKKVYEMIIEIEIDDTSSVFNIDPIDIRDEIYKAFTHTLPRELYGNEVQVHFHTPKEKEEPKNGR